METVNFAAEIAALKQATNAYLGTVLRGIEDLALFADEAEAEHSAAKAEKSMALAEIARELENCARCGLHVGRTHIVASGGATEARLFIVLDPPDMHEDKAARPAQNEPGELLEKMLLAMGIRREETYIANIVRCRPPNDRTPDAAELDTCFQFLKREIALIRPQAVLAMGELAAQALARTEAPLSHLRGKWHDHNGVPVMPTYHPQQLLETASLKKLAWDDLQKVMRRLEAREP